MTFMKLLQLSSYSSHCDEETYRPGLIHSLWPMSQKPTIIVSMKVDNERKITQQKVKKHK
jgi:hypothetical protein